MKTLRKFTAQTFSDREINEAIRNNMTIDYRHGHVSILEAFVERHPEHVDHLAKLRRLGADALGQEERRVKSRSLLLATIMLTGKCNANCPICYLDAKRHVQELTESEIVELIDKARELGARTVYVPGEGEPTLDDAFLSMLHYAEKRSLRVIIFTNGVLLCRDDKMLKVWGMTSEDFVKAIKQLPVYVYHKLWSTRPRLAESMTGVPEGTYAYETVKARGGSVSVPRGLALLMRHLPSSRVGVECVADRRNCEEILDTIVPFIKHARLRAFIEPIIHSGRAFGKYGNDPTPAQIQRLAPLMARVHCTRVAYHLVVRNDGYLSPGIALHPKALLGGEGGEELAIRDGKGGIIDLYEMLHTNELLVKGRYQLNGCFCEIANRRLAADQPIFD